MLYLLLKLGKHQYMPIYPFLWILALWLFTRVVWQFDRDGGVDLSPGLTVVLVDDYLDGRLADFNRERLAQKQDWLLVQRSVNPSNPNVVEERGSALRKLFIYAVLTRQVIQSSLGYFINPLLSVLLGVVILRERLRKSYIACRYGGDEFVLVLPESPLEASRERLEKIHMLVKEHRSLFERVVHCSQGYRFAPNSTPFTTLPA